MLSRSRTSVTALKFSFAIVLVFFLTSAAWGSIGIDANVSKDQGSAQKTVTSPSFSTSAPNELLLAFVATDYISGSNTTVTAVTGGGVTWALVLRTNKQSGTAEIWRGFATSTLSNITVSATLSQSVASSMTVMSFTGVDTSGTNGSGAIGATKSASASRGAPSATLVSTRNSSWIFGVGNDYDNAIARTPGTAQTVVHQDLTSAGDTYWVQMQNSPTLLSGTSVSINDTAPTGDRYNLSIVEILPLTTGGGSTFSISGAISPAASGSGTTLLLSGAATTSVTADSSGNFTFTGLANGSYTITPSKTGFTFSPASAPVTIASANVTGVNFTVTAVVSTFSISGTISPAASGSGATLLLSGAATASATADSSGNFTFTGLANGNYTITPSKTGFTFSPASASVTITSANVTGVNFTATAIVSTFSISGTISPAASGSGTSVSLSGAATASVTADSSGNFTFTGLANGSYTITPSKTGFTFSPTSAPVTIASANVTGVNFTAAPTSLGTETIFTTQSPAITNASDGSNVNYELGTVFTSDVAGQITAIRFWKASNETGTHTGHLWTAAGQLLTTVAFSNETASGWQQQALTSAIAISANTQYVVSVNTGGTYYVDTNNGLASAIVDQDLSTIVGNNGLYGSPAQFPTKTYQQSNYFRDVAFSPNGGVSTFSISGTISPAASGSGTSVSLSGAAAASVTADSSGNFTFTGLANGSYTVTPSKTGFTFTPASAPVTVNGSNVTGVNFTATAVVSTFSISGTISPAASGSGATLSLSGTATASATADSSGNFTFTGLANGSYTITPSKTGFTFSPASAPVTITSANVTGVNFTATAVVSTFSISGAISPSAGGAGATVSLSGTASASTTADSSGNYIFTALPNGTYSVTPSNSGYTFSPATLNETISGANVTGIDFTAQQAQSSGIHLIQKNVNGNESATANMSVTFPANNTLGDFLIVTGTAARPASTITISDTAGNTYIPAIGPVTDTNQDVTAYIWYVPNCKGGSNTVTITPSTTAALEIHVSEWSGLAAASPLDQTATATGTGTAISSGSKTTAINGELVFGYTFPINDATAGTGFTGISFVDGDWDEYLIQPTAGPTAATFTQTSGTWFALMATFVPAGGGSPSSWNVSGTITPASEGVGSTVSLSGAASATTTADSSGNYAFTGLANGSYTVTPSKSGDTFTPGSQPVTINGANLSGVNFSAQNINPPPASLSMDVNISADQSSASATVTSPAFSTTSANELLLAFVGTDYLSGANVTVTGVSGGGLAWVLVYRTNVQSGTSEIWRAFANSPLSSVTVKATLSQNVSSSMTIMSFTGADATGVNGAAAIGATAGGNASSGAPTATLITSRNGSWVVGVGNDYDNAIGRTAGTGQTLVHQYLSPVGDTYWVQIQSGTTPLSGTTVVINDTAPTGDRYNLAIAEVLPALPGGGGGGTPPSIAMTSPAPGTVLANTVIVAASANGQGYAITGVQFLLDGINLGTQVTQPPYSTTWNTTTASAGTHTLAAIAYNSAGLNATSASVTVTVDNSGNTAVVGSWSSVFSLPAVAVNLTLLKNNTVLFYQDGSSPTVWDYLNNKFTSVPAPADLFCSGQTALADGRILVVGGYGESGSTLGIPNSEIFDPVTNSWTVTPKMSYSRWYPTATTLSDGRVLVTAGWQTTDHTNAGVPEIYDPIANTWTKLTNANNPFETYPFIYQLSDGRLIHVGGSEYPVVTDILDLTTQTWSVVDSNIVDGGSASMYLPDKIMKAGSATDSQVSGPSSNTTYVLDMTQPSPAWVQTPSMVYPRSFLNLTELPDGTVLATGGETDKNGGNISNAVYAAELWSPQTQTWQTLSSMHTPREYHGTAVLLPDARVMVSGMGADFGNVPNEMSAEFFSPPYLFKGARPTITQAPATISYGQNFFVATPDATSIASAVLIRTGAATHFFDQNARFVPVTFQQASGGLTLQAPSTATLAPPGYYLLFIVNTNGVPSVAPFVQLQ